MNTSLSPSPLALCDLTRRAFCELLGQRLRLASPVLHGIGGLSLAESDAAAGGPARKAKNVIFLQMVGGMSHIDTLDLKDGPTQDRRSPSAPVPGFQLGGTMENPFARQADKISTVDPGHEPKTGVHAAGQMSSAPATSSAHRQASEHRRLGAAFQRSEPRHPLLQRLQRTAS
ncbi:MAG: DUF1501 domain-containing protein [Prosthecobacter sp.]